MKDKRLDEDEPKKLFTVRILKTCEFNVRKK